MIFSLIESSTIALALTIDTLVAAVAYGSEKIKIPLSSAIIISATSAIIVALSSILGDIASAYIDSSYITFLAFALLFLLGFSKILAELKVNSHNYFTLKPFEISVINYLTTLTHDATNADTDKDKFLSRKEALSLSLILSLDGGAAGLSVGMTATNQIPVVIITFLANFVAILIGCKCGGLLAKKSNFSIAWLGGIILMAMAVTKL